MKKVEINFSPPLPAQINIYSNKWGIIIAHGEKSSYDTGIIAALSKKLGEKKISSLRFAFPFSIEKVKYDKNPIVLDDAFSAVYRFANSEYPDKQWILCGHGIGAESAIRIAPIVDEFGDLPPIICLNYPLYPPNRPDKVNMRSLGAIIGSALFCQGTESNRGDFKRLKNSIKMMAGHVHTAPIRGANYQMQVKGKEDTTVAYWISNDIDKFLLDIN